MKSPRRLLVGLLLALSLVGCEDTRRPSADSSVGWVDSGPTSDGGADSSARDGGALVDSGSVDSGADSGAEDSGAEDSGAADSGAEDAGTDSNVPDSGTGLAPQAGDLVIVEIQGNPVRATDEQAEYFEVLNVSGRVLDLRGVTITHISFVGGEPVASADRHVVDQVLFVEPGERLLFGSSDGGFFGTGDPDYVYSGILISNAETEMTRLRLMVPDWDGSEPPNLLDLVDEVIVESRVFGNAVRGQALQFDPARGTPTSASNDDAANWCTTPAEAAFEYRGSNFGTPGAPNVCD